MTTINNTHTPNSVGTLASLLRWFSKGLNREVQASEPIENIYPGMPVDWKVTSAAIQALWNDGIARDDFNSAWQKSSLETQRNFVVCLDNDKSPESLQIRQIYLNVIYRPLPGSIMEWPSQESETFYHATPTLANATSILTSREIRVTHQKVYKAAFVSTIYITGYGNYAFVFRRYIERLSPLNRELIPPARKELGEPTGFLNSDHRFYAAGFSNSIPLNEYTLAAVLINSPDYEADKAALQELGWPGLRIEKYDATAKPCVLPLIPSEWPSGVR